MLKVQNLTFRYGGKSILSNISFDVKPESITALVGSNGSGKTTLLRCLNLFLKPQQGEILLNGRSISTFSSNALARKIAYMPQRSGITDLTVFDAILLGRKPYLSWMPEPNDYQLVEKTLKRLNLLDKSLQPLDRLSGGELQKVSLGRIFVQEPELVLLDEPMSALDLKNRLEIMRHLIHFVHHYKTTVIMSIHDLNDAFQIADQLLLLKNGELLANESIKNVSDKMLADLYDIPLELYYQYFSQFMQTKGVES